MPNNNSCSSLSLTSALILVRDTIYTFNQISYSTDEKTIENINVLDIEFSILRYNVIFPIFCVKHLLFCMNNDQAKSMLNVKN